MTANQLKYRANLIEKQKADAATKANEISWFKANEEQRRNLMNEFLERESQKLEKEGLDIKNRESLLKLVDLYNKYGMIDFQQAPQSVKDAMNQAFGTEDVYHNEDVFNLIWDIMKHFGNWMSAKDVGKILAI